VFKCKQCGRQFGANVPGSCPECGARQEAGKELRGAWRIFELLAVVPDEIGCFFILLAGLLVCIVGTLNWLFGWFW